MTTIKKRKSDPLSGISKIKGGFEARGLRLALVVSEFNEYFTRELLSGTVDTLLRHGANKKDIQIFYVPGAFEIPLVAKRVLQKKKWDAVITLAVVIRGETKHFDQVVKETARSLRQLCDKSEVPVILGIIPANTVSQAAERVGIKQMNKGREWALAAIETANLMRNRLLRKK